MGEKKYYNVYDTVREVSTVKKQNNLEEYAMKNYVAKMIRFSLLSILVLVITLLPVSAQEKVGASITSTGIERPVSYEGDLKTPGDNYKTVALRVLLGTSYRSDYSTPETEASTSIDTMELPFKVIWGINFVPSFAYVSPLPIDYCSLDIFTFCTDGICGSGCNNAINNVIHHKNIAKNLNKVRNDISLTGYDLILTLVSSTMCSVETETNTHNQGYLGLGDVNGNYAVINNCSSASQIMRIRTMQHEISHMYGCVDLQCTPGVPCIMNGGFDNASLAIGEIWCPNCIGYFNPLLH